MLSQKKQIVSNARNFDLVQMKIICQMQDLSFR